MKKPQRETDLGYYLREGRKKKGITRAEAARQAAVAEPYLYQLEAGIKENAGPALLMRLAEHYEEDLWQWLGSLGYLREEKKVRWVERDFPVLIWNASFLEGLQSLMYAQRWIHDKTVEHDQETRELYEKKVLDKLNLSKRERQQAKEIPLALAALTLKLVDLVDQLGAGFGQASSEEETHCEYLERSPRNLDEVFDRVSYYREEDDNRHAKSWNDNWRRLAKRIPTELRWDPKTVDETLPDELKELVTKRK